MSGSPLPPLKFEKCPFYLGFLVVVVVVVVVVGFRGFF